MGLGTTAGSDIETCAVSSRDAARESDVALRDATRKLSREAKCQQQI
jgi:hypothetical protein